MGALNCEVKDMSNEDLHDYLRDMLQEYVGDLEDDHYSVIEEAAQRLLDMG